MTDPVKTIAKALQLASASFGEIEGRNQIIIASGVFTFTVSDLPTLKSGVSIFGGYTNNSGIWTETDEDYWPTIRIPATGWKLDKLHDITISKIKIASASDTNPSGSSLGLILNKCTNITLDLIDISTADGSNGTDGEAGVKGDDGGNGENGIEGCEESTFLCSKHCENSIPTGAAGGKNETCGANGGKGGDAGKGNSSGYAGANGVGSTSNGGPGGNEKYWSDTANECSRSSSASVNGRDGLPGNNGANGAGGKSYGTFSVSGYTPSDGTDGEDGTNGQGGGGGGGGRGGVKICNSYGSSGGGGGAGGCGGKGGKGGKGGGASIPLMVFSSTNILFKTPSFHTGNGGKGGNGGNGGDAGNHGFGGSAGQYSGPWEQDDGGCGGWGGDGGDGGIGGIGGGGGGGPIICVVYDANSSLYKSSSMKCNEGEVKTPGSGGESTANSGMSGTKKNILKIDL